MSLGKYGPYVHIVSCIATCLPYKALEYNKTLKH
jgi:H+/Cl- antiporter ClcA